MALNFPPSPSIGQIYAGGTNSSTWIFNGTSWVIYAREYGIDWGSYTSGSLPRFITDTQTLPAGKQAVVWDLWISGNFTIAAGDTNFSFGTTNVSNDALLNIRDTLNITGSFTVLGIVQMVF